MTLAEFIATPLRVVRVANTAWMTGQLLSAGDVVGINLTTAIFVTEERENTFRIVMMSGAYLIVHPLEFSHAAG